MINLIVDLNYLFHRTLNVMTGSWANPFQDNESESQFIRKIITDISYEMRQIKRYDRLIVCVDSKSWRKTYDPSYKGNREKAPDSPINWDRFYQVMDIITDLLKTRGAIISKQNNAEADDLIYLWCDYLFSKKESAIILTADRDLYQCVNSSFECNSQVILINNNSKTRKLVVHPNFEKSVVKPEFDIFNQSSIDDTLHDLYTKHEILEVDPEFHVFSKILEGDKGDNIMSVWNWKSPKGDNKKISPGITKKVYTSINENKDLDYWDTYMNETKWNALCINLEIYSKQKIDRDILKENYIRNLNLVFLSKKVIPETIQDEFLKLTENMTYISLIDISIFKGTSWEKQIEVKSDIFKSFAKEKYFTDNTINELKINELW